MNRFFKAAAVVAIATAAVIGGPLAANAATGYVPGTPTVTGAAAGTVTGSTVSGGRFTVHFNAIFKVNHQLSVYFVSSGDVPMSLGDFRAAQSPALATATDATGAAAVTATMPADASAPVTVQATDGTTTAAITITVAGAAAPAAVTTTGASPLASTGTYISLVTVWGAVGLVALGAGFLAVRGYRRRNLASAGAHRR